MPCWDAHERALFAALLTEQDVDIMAWAIGTQEAPERFQGPMMDGAPAARLHQGGQVSDALQRILKAEEPLTLAGVPAGFLPWLAADLARAAHGTGKGGRAVIIAADEAAMRALADTVPVFAPEVEVLTFPAWDCLPYDRASPALRVMAERLATLRSLQAKRKGPQLLIATANAATQRMLTPFRIRQLTRRLAEGERIERDRLVGAADRQRLPAHRRGPRRRRIRGARVDRRPVPGRREPSPSGSTSSATRSRPCGASTPPTSARPARPKPSP